jgi:hypothetical protein
MNLQAEKIEIMRMVLDTKNPSILKSIKNLLWKEEKSDFWETLPQTQKDDIEEGLRDLKDGNVVNYDEFIQKHR